MSHYHTQDSNVTLLWTTLLSHTVKRHTFTSHCLTPHSHVTLSRALLSRHTVSHHTLTSHCHTPHSHDTLSRATLSRHNVSHHTLTSHCHTPNSNITLSRTTLLSYTVTSHNFNFTFLNYMRKYKNPLCIADWNILLGSDAQANIISLYKHFLHNVLERTLNYSSGIIFWIWNLNIPYYHIWQNFLVEAPELWIVVDFLSLLRPLRKERTIIQK